MSFNPSCSVPGDACSPPGGYITLGLCRNHYSRLQRERLAAKRGTPLRYRAPNGAPLAFLLAAVEYSGEECLEWPYAVDGKGYGKMVIDGKFVQVHREVLIRHSGPPPDPTMEACHAAELCHNRRCCSPLHIRWDTTAGNHADKLADGTHNRGERNVNAVLTLTDAQAIYDELTRPDKRSQEAIAFQYGITQTAVSFIARGINWPEVDRSVPLWPGRARRRKAA